MGAAADGRLAAAWLACYERLAAAAAHEVHNALNGVGMNLEVVRLRAQPGADAGRAAPFAAAALEDHESTVALVRALLALGRAPTGPGDGADAAAVLGQVAALLGPALRHRGVTLRVEAPATGLRTAAPLRAARLAICAALEAGAGEAGRAAGGTAARGGRAWAEDEPRGVLGCNLRAGAAVVLAVTPGALPDATAREALADAGVQVALAPEGLRVTFPPA